MSQPLLVVLAGPNGAGKSTFYAAFLAQFGLPFLNADRLVAETGMGAYEAAGVIARLRGEMIGRQIGFVTETVLSDPVGEKVAAFAKAVEAGFDVQLIFVGIADAQMSVERVAARVSAGGHDVPEEKLRARFARTLENLRRAVAVLPRVTVFDNSCFEAPFRLVAEFRDGVVVKRGAGELPGWAREVVGFLD